MEEEAPKTEQSGSAAGSSHNLTVSVQEGTADTEILVPSFNPRIRAVLSTPTGTLSRLGMSLRGQAAALTPGSPTESSARGQVSAITVVALLDKLVNMLESVQENQKRMETRQEELEGAVRAVQGDVTRLSKAHLSTANSVNKLLERSRKVSGGVKEVKERLDKQGAQVKRLENNHAHLLKRNHFKVLIFQEDNEIPTDVFVKDSLKSPSQFDADSVRPPSVAGSVAGSVAASVSMAPSVSGSVDVRSPAEGLHTVSLTSDEEEDLTLHHHEQTDEGADADSTLGFGQSRGYERRADRFKRNSLKKVDSLKRAFTKENIEKKVQQITTKIVPLDKRGKIIKSMTPNHPKSPTSKSSSFKVTPMTFNVKKVRDSQSSTPEASPITPEAHVDIPPLGSLDADTSLELHPNAAAVSQVREALRECSVQAEIAVNGEVSVEMNGEQLPEETVEELSAEVGPEAEVEVSGGAGLAVPESVEDVGDEDDEGEESPAEGASEEAVATETSASATITAPTIAAPTIAAPTIAVEQAS
ncbi:hypothetical protein WMY93_002036 [Mugilogobius chulae]|uniref:Serum deprivation-response protein n=1 Tax=Mugilogobius chulae TaxID=88201 RepID=A0AAW0PT91_9GOBI